MINGDRPRRRISGSGRLLDRAGHDQDRPDWVICARPRASLRQVPTTPSRRSALRWSQRFFPSQVPARTPLVGRLARGFHRARAVGGEGSRRLVDQPVDPRGCGDRHRPAGHAAADHGPARLVDQQLVGHGDGRSRHPGADRPGGGGTAEVAAGVSLGGWDPAIAGYLLVVVASDWYPTSALLHTGGPRTKPVGRANVDDIGPSPGWTRSSSSLPCAPEDVMRLNMEIGHRQVGACQVRVAKAGDVKVAGFRGHLHPQAGVPTSLLSWRMRPGRSPRVPARRMPT